MRKFALTLLATAVFGAGLMFAGLPKAAKPEFAPGQRVVIQVGSWTIEGTVEESQQSVNRKLKGDRLVRADGEPAEERIFHTAAERR